MLIPHLVKFPKRRWRQPDRILFGFCTCQILPGLSQEEYPFEASYGEWILPNDGYSETYMNVTYGLLTFAYHGTMIREKILS